MIPSPCVGTCRIDQASGLCIGCARTSAEVAAWREAPAAVLERIWAELPERRARLGIELHRLSWARDQIRSFIAETLRADGGTWVFGVFGAVAEFCISRDEPVTLERNDTNVIATTSRAAIRVEITDPVRALSLSGSAPSATTGVIVLAIPRPRARPPLPIGLSLNGPDREAVRQEDRDGQLYDLGLGRDAANFCVRTADPGLIRDLNGHIGQTWPEFLADLGGRIIQASPTRVIRSPIGRIEVNVPIPPPGGRSPDGPHTHFLPVHLSGGRETPPGLEIPEVFMPCAFFYPGPAVVPGSCENT